MTRTLLKGDALHLFDLHKTKIITTGIPTTEHLRQVLRAIGEDVFPNRALTKQKRYMRRFMKKPLKMSWRNFIAEMVQMNDKLERFPPYAVDQTLPAAEVLEIAEFGAPAHWQRSMIEHNFDCAQKPFPK